MTGAASPPSLNGWSSNRSWSGSAGRNRFPVPPGSCGKWKFKRWNRRTGNPGMIFWKTPSSPSGWRWTGKIITGRRSSAWPFPTGRRTCMFPGGPPGLENLHRLLADEERKKIVYDGKRLQVVLKRRGLEAGGLAFDALLASYLLDPSESGHSLSDLVQRKMDGSLPPDEEVYGKGAKRRLPGEKRAGGAPGPQGGGAEAPLSPAQRGDPGGRHGVPAVRDGAAPVSGCWPKWSSTESGWTGTGFWIWERS